jgi:WD40 repeat protein
VFVSSTFEDLKEERNALAAPGGPFAELTKLCQSFGARFQAIDLRWGVREEAGLDQRTMEICLGEIERCQRTGIKPNFIVLLGDRYGWRPLPVRIEAEEFRALRDRMADAEDRARVDDWYRLDENAVPPECLLRPRTGEFKDIQRWGDVETPMHKALRDAARAAGLSGDALIKYEASATHQEILKGLGKTAEDREHVFAFFRKPSEPNEGPDLTSLKQLLRDELKGNVFEPRAASELCERVRENLERVIRAEAAAFKSRTALDIEVEAHDAFARDRARHFMGRKDVLDSIEQYVKGGTRRPLVVHGASGSGKSAVMARALEVLLGNPRNAVVIRRFIGVTPESSSGITLLRSLCEEIGRRYGVTEEIPVEFHSLVRTFAGRLALGTADRTLILFIDALDEIAASDPAADITWLMPELPRHCRVVLSTTDVARSLEAARLVELGALPAEDAEEALALWLHDARRELRVWQREKVLAYYGRCGLPLYLRLAFEESRRWRSFDEPEACELREGLAGIIDVLLDRLSSDGSHGNFLVSRSLGYLATARYGLTDDEMLDLLTRDPAVWQEFDAAKRHDPPERRLPVIVWSRLFLDLEPYLTGRAAPGGTVATFYHRQLRERIHDRYLAGSQAKERHEALTGYFGRQSHWLGEAWRQPNARKAIELVYQQLGAGLTDEATATLSDLCFVTAKCAASLVFDLQEDYRRAFDMLPEAQAELADDRRRLERVQKYARDLIAYAKQDIQILEVPESVEPHNDERSDEEARGSCKNPTLYTLRAFAEFVRMESYPLSEFASCPGFTVQHAFNSAPSGPVHDAAEQVYLTVKEPILARHWSKNNSHEPKRALLRLLEGHTGTVTDISMSADGCVAISSSEDNTLRLWDIQTGQCLYVIHGQATADSSKPNKYGLVSLWADESYFTCVSLSADGKVALSGSTTGALIAWDMKTGHRLRTLQGGGYRVCSIALSTDASLAISGSGQLSRSGYSGTTMSLWDISAGKCALTSEHHSPVNAVSLSANGQYALSSGPSRRLQLWNVKTLQQVCDLAGHDLEPSVGALSANGCWAISGGYDKTLRVWNLENRLCSHVLNHPGVVTAVALSADGKRALSGSADGFLRFWDLVDGRLLGTVRGHAGAVRGVCLRADARLAVSAGADRSCRVWDPQLIESLPDYNARERGPIVDVQL